MREYVVNTVWQVLWSGALLIGVPVAVAWLLQRIGDRIRTIGCLKCALGYRCGRAYWYFVATGIACHETGHAVGAWITGNRALEFVPFALISDRGDTDMKNARMGFALTLGIVLVLLFMPFVGKWIAVIVYVLMILAVFINMGFLFLERLIVRIT